MARKFNWKDYNVKETQVEEYGLLPHTLAFRERVLYELHKRTLLSFARKKRKKKTFGREEATPKKVHHNLRSREVCRKCAAGRVYYVLSFARKRVNGLCSSFVRC